MSAKKYSTKKRRHPLKRNLKRKIRKIAFMLVAGIIASGINYYNNHVSSSKNDALKQATRIDTSSYYDPNATPSTDPKTLHKLYQAKNNPNAKLWVTVHGMIVKSLKDDLEGSRHQKFLIKIDDNFTLLISHNIDLAPHVPIKAGQVVSVSGLYEWNSHGGVIHWTHHDPKGRKKGGWVKVKGKKYQ